MTLLAIPTETPASLATSLSVTRLVRPAFTVDPAARTALMRDARPAPTSPAGASAAPSSCRSSHHSPGPGTDCDARHAGGVRPGWPDGATRRSGRASGPLGDPAAPDLGARDVLPELGLRQALAGVTEALGHRDLGERTVGAAHLAAGHEEATAARPDRLERGAHRRRVAVVEAGVDDPLGRVDADDEHAAGEELRLLREQRRAGDRERGPARELERPLARLGEVDGRLGRVHQGQLERRREPGVAGRGLGEAPVPLVDRVERAREERSGAEALPVGHAALRRDDRQLARAGGDGLDQLAGPVLDPQELRADQRQWRGAEDAAGVGHGPDDHEADETLLALAVACALLDRDGVDDAAEAVAHRARDAVVPAL